MQTQLFKPKNLIIVGCLAVAAGLAYLATLEDAKPAKYYRVELEEKVRPARFEDLKFKLDPGVDVRAPASADH